MGRNEAFSVGQAVGVGGGSPVRVGLPPSPPEQRSQVELAEHVFDSGDAQGEFDGGDGLLVGFADDTEGEGFGGGGSSLDEDDSFPSLACSRYSAVPVAEIQASSVAPRCLPKATDLIR